MNLLKAGVIGIGFIGPVHIEAVRRTGLANVIAVTDEDYEKAKTFADSADIERVYHDYHELIADPDIDVVHICVPNHLHYDIVKECLANGKHVVCDKPLAIPFCPNIPCFPFHCIFNCCFTYFCTCTIN